MKQTAVDLLDNELWNLRLKLRGGEISFDLYFEQEAKLIVQAKEMEKQQIKDAYEQGFDDAWDDAKYDEMPQYAGAEQYYNENHGGKNE